MTPPEDTAALVAELAHARPGDPTFDERRAQALVTQRLLGKHAAVPLQLERYVVSGRLGSGGNGIVYRAWDPVLRRFVALKLLRRDAEDTTDPHDGRALLLAESRRSAKVDHPNVARVYAVSREPRIDAWFIVMELLPGMTLRAWAQERERTTSELALVLQSAARGLDAAHELGVTHGDFKPDNVLFDAEGTVCVADFGGRGTPRYLAPEVAAGSPARPSADIYSFAVTVDELWGSRPRSSRLDRMLRRALASAPERRPSTASAIAQSLTPRRGRLLRVAAASTALVAVLALAPSVLSLPCALAPLQIPDGFPPEAGEATSSYVEAWNTQRNAYCEAPREHVMRCLEQTRLQWNRVAELVRVSPQTDRTAAVIAGLAAPSACTEPSQEATSPLRDTFHTLEIEVHAANDLGLWAERGPGLERRLADLRRRALEIGDVAVEADVTLYQGYYAVGRGEIAKAQADFEAAYLLGTRSGDAHTAFFSASNLVRVYGEMLDDPVSAARWVAAAHRASRDRTSPEARGDALAVAARQAVAERDVARAIRLFDQAEAAYGEETGIGAWVDLHCGRGRAYRDSEQHEAALADFRRGLARLKATAVQDNLSHSCLLNGLGTTARLVGESEEARGALERLHRLMLRELPDSPDIASVLGNLAQLNSDAGEHALALAQFREVHEVFAKLAGPQAPPTSMTRYSMAVELMALDRDEEARVEAEAALRWAVPEPYAAGSRILLARLALRRGERAEAAAFIAEIDTSQHLGSEVREELKSFHQELAASDR